MLFFQENQGLWQMNHVCVAHIWLTASEEYIVFILYLVRIRGKLQLWWDLTFYLCFGHISTWPTNISMKMYEYVSCGLLPTQPPIFSYSKSTYFKQTVIVYSPVHPAYTASCTHNRPPPRQHSSQSATCSWSRRRLQKVDKRMVLEHTHGLFIT